MTKSVSSIYITTLIFLQLTISSGICANTFNECLHSLLNRLIDTKNKTVDIMSNLNKSHYYATQLRLHIMTENNGVEYLNVPLKQLEMIHPITHEKSKEKLQMRINKLVSSKEKILNKKTLTIGEANALIPSKNPIRVVELENGKYIIFDGNGRYEAIRNVFETDDFVVEVENYKITEKKRINEMIKEILRIRFPEKY